MPIWYERTCIFRRKSDRSPRGSWHSQQSSTFRNTCPRPLVGHTSAGWVELAAHWYTRKEEGVSVVVGGLVVAFWVVVAWMVVVVVVVLVGGAGCWVVGEAVAVWVEVGCVVDAVGVDAVVVTSVVGVEGVAWAVVVWEEVALAGVGYVGASGLFEGG